MYLKKVVSALLCVILAFTPITANAYAEEISTDTVTETVLSESSETEEKTLGNLRYLSSSLSSYGVKKASYLNTEEGQLLLNRYYGSMKEIGMNATNNLSKIYGNPELVKEYQADIDKITENQKKVFEMYKVDENSLELKK